MVATYQDLEFNEGDDFPYKITLTNSSGIAIDLTGYTFYMTIKYELTDSDANAMIKKTITTIPNPELGIVTITLDRSDTQNMAGGVYVYDIKYLTSGTLTKTIIRGNFNLIKGVTDIV